MSDQENVGFFQNFVNNIEDYINNLVTLDIKTIVGDFHVNGEKDEIVKKEGTDYKVMNSKIHLLKGDVTSYVSNDLVQDRYAWVRDFHAQKEQHGHAIINDNIKAVYSLFELYAKTKGVDVPPADSFYSSAASAPQQVLPTATAQPALSYNPEETAFDPSQTAAAAPDYEAAAFDPASTAAAEEPIADAPALDTLPIDYDAPAATSSDEGTSAESDNEENTKKEEE
ncbi:hypothetical protein [Flammeovirga sp. EKP202]|uniref:hypothetical protein n=1 Tax=Flammeovirga sp. EKP202 TaxID=2770592 RepID=UPI00165F40C1|nr:hypothetical protein [Flammeovirga sp. EKP202]MBD0402755.1 hypothetical protein [Flammeovirga sp. EKP202]